MLVCCKFSVIYFASLNMHSMLCCMCSVVTWRIHKEKKKKVHNFPGKTANTCPRETTGALDSPEMCTGTPDRVKCTEMKVPGMAQTDHEESYKGKMEVFSLSNNIAYTSSANHKLELDTDPEYETITV